MSEGFIKSFIVDISNYLNQRTSTLKSFTRHGVQVEAWFKGELLSFLDKYHNPQLNRYEREVLVGSGRKKADFKLQIIKSKNIWIELKHWLIGIQKGVRWYARSYFSDRSSVGIFPDVEKLSRLKDDKYFIILATANPGKNDWYEGIQKFNNKFNPYKIRSLNDPSNYPESYFLGLLEIM